MNNPIFDHMDQCFNQLLARESRFTFTYRFQGRDSDVSIVSDSYKKAENHLYKALPGGITILGCKETAC